MSGLSPTPVRNVCMCECLTLSADRPDHIRLLRTHVSRKAVGVQYRSRAVLEGVGLYSRTIEECFSTHPISEEEAVQAGLTKWCRGQGTQPPTWSVLIKAMEYAGIAQHYIQGLEEGLVLLGMLLIYYYAVLCLCVCVCVCLCVCGDVFNVLCGVSAVRACHMLSDLYVHTV